MGVKEAIILAGGLGTRLHSEVPDLPKCMAPVAGKPFIDHLIEYFSDAGIQSFVFALGYKSETVIQHLQNHWPDLIYSCSIEQQPLGTGGAILLATQHIKAENFLVLNGDTLFSIDPDLLLNVHHMHHAFITVALKPMENFERYGTVKTDEHRRIIGFKEKTFCTSGLINGGIYLINKNLFLSLQLPERFSFEKDVLEIQTKENIVFGVVFDDYFIDIGIPEDFRKANEDLKNSGTEI